MKLAHMADAHLGFQRFGGSRSEVRKHDVFNAFAAACQTVTEESTDVLVIAGDLFDSPDPDNETLLFALRWLHTLRDVGVEVIIASGNHETPKSSRTHVFNLLNDLGFKAVYEETTTYDILDTRFVVVPWTFNQLNWEEIPAGDVLVVHTAAMASPGSSGSYRVWPPDLELKWDYVALGDWHKRINLHSKGNVWYPGALEHFSFGEEGADCGVLFYMSGITAEPYAWGVPVREMVTIGMDLDTMENPDVEVTKLLQPYADACVRLQLSGMPTLLDPRTVEWHSLLQLEYVGENRTSGPQFAPSDALSDWQEYCNYAEVDKALRRYGRVYLKEFV
jgi:DNA repair exonuclease SbcCD nuclease subunit